MTTCKCGNQDLIAWLPTESHYKQVEGRWDHECLFEIQGPITVCCPECGETWEQQIDARLIPVRDPDNYGIYVPCVETEIEPDASE